MGLGTSRQPEAQQCRAGVIHVNFCVLCRLESGAWSLDSGLWTLLHVLAGTKPIGRLDVRWSHNLLRA